LVRGIIGAQLRALPPEDRTVLTAYETDLRQAVTRSALFAARRQRCASIGAGRSTLGTHLLAARRLLQRGAGPTHGRLTADDTLAVLADRRRSPVVSAERTFLGWLALTGRHPLPTGVLEALEHVGQRAARHKVSRAPRHGSPER
jgi:hypothetical protein